MNINLKNYESWFLDYHEGKLDKIHQKMLYDFLDLHPELLDELYAYDKDIKLNKDQGLHLDEEILKVPDVQNFDELLISLLENELSPQESHKTQLLLQQNKKLAREYSIFKKTILKPDLNLCFTGKNKLKKGKSKIIRLIYYSTAAAAACIMFFIFYTSKNYFQNTPVNQTQTFSSETLYEFKVPKPLITIEIPDNLALNTEENEKLPEPKPDKLNVFENQLTTIENLPLIKIKKIKTDLNYTLLNKSPEKIEIPEFIFIGENYFALDVKELENDKNNIESSLKTKSLIVNQIKNIINPEQEINVLNNVLELADISTNTISKVSNHEINFSHNKNIDGAITSFSINIGGFKFSRSFGK